MSELLSLEELHSCLLYACTFPHIQSSNEAKRFEGTVASAVNKISEAIEVGVL